MIWVGQIRQKLLDTCNVALDGTILQQCSIGIVFAQNVSTDGLVTFVTKDQLNVMILCQRENATLLK